MKLVFLDLDGVLNSNKYFQHPKYKEECNALDLRDYYGTDVLDLAPYLHLDPNAIRLLNGLLEKTGAQVILSSNWRLHHSIEQVTQWLQMRSAKFTILDKTPTTSTWTPRGHQIKLFFESFNDKVESYVILDDLFSNEFKSFKKNFIHTDPNVGLTIENVNRAIDILNENV